MKAKTKKRLIIWISILVALALVGYFGYRAALVFVGDKAMDMMLENQLNSMLDSGEITIEELEKIAESDHSATVEEEPAETPAPTETETAEKPAEASTPKPAPAEPAKPAPKPAETTAPAKPAERKETVKKAADNIGFGITREDKEAMAKLITKRLSGSDISYLAGLLSGGLTREERSAAYKVAVARFSGSELSQVSSFYHKYKKAIMIEPDYPSPEDLKEENQVK